MAKTVLITGASRGIGKSTAEYFASKDYNVIINYNNSEKEAVSLAEKIGAFAVRADVSNISEVIKMLDEIHFKFGKITALVNNAGIAIPQKTILDTTEEEFDRLFSVNVKGVYNVSKAVIPDLLEAGGGSIVNISSMWGIAGGSCETLYSATKAAVIGFTKALAKELSLSNIRVNAVAPGFIDTDMNKNLSKEDAALCLNDIPLGRYGSPEDVAEAIYFLTENANFITGEILSVNGGEVI